MTINIGCNARDLENRSIRTFVEGHEAESITVSIGSDLAGLDVARDLARSKNLQLGVHLVEGNLSPVPCAIENAQDAFAAALSNAGADWVVQDMGTWTFDGRHQPSAFISAVLDHESLASIKRRAVRLSSLYPMPVLLENPPYTCVYGDIELCEFMRELQSEGIRIGLDLSHWYSYYLRVGKDPRGALERLEPSLVDEFHVSGGGIALRGGQRYFVDVHGNSAVGPEVVALLEAARTTIGSRRVVFEIFGARSGPALASRIEELARDAG